MVYKTALLSVVQMVAMTATMMVEWMDALLDENLAKQMDNETVEKRGSQRELT